MTLPVQVFSGLFWEDSGTLYVKDESAGKVDVTQILRSFLGREVQVTAHHLPNRARPYAPGVGSCFAGSRCEVGHPFRPYYLWDFQATGVLESNSEEVWSIGGRPFEEKMLVGHECRLVLAAKLPEGDSDGNLGSLQQEAAGISEILQALQEIVEHNS
jgi:hypothetical protein